MTFTGVVYEVTSTGHRPVEGAEIIWCDSGSCRPDSAVRSGPDGSYVIHVSGAVGSVSLLARKDGYAHALSAPSIGSGTIRVYIQLLALPSSGHGVFGVVYEVTATGNVPISGARIWSCDDALGFSCAPVFLSAADGRYRVEYSGEGTGYLFVEKPGFHTHSAELLVVGYVEHNVALARR